MASPVGNPSQESEEDIPKLMPALDKELELLNSLLLSDADGVVVPDLPRTQISSPTTSTCSDVSELVMLAESPKQSTQQVPQQPPDTEKRRPNQENIDTYKPAIDKQPNSPGSPQTSSEPGPTQKLEPTPEAPTQSQTPVPAINHDHQPSFSVADEAGRDNEEAPLGPPPASPRVPPSPAPSAATQPTESEASSVAEPPGPPFTALPKQPPFAFPGRVFGPAPKPTLKTPSAMAASAPAWTPLAQ
jgi:hypothetical protein